jgi:outer membrane protein
MNMMMRAWKVVGISSLAALVSAMPAQADTVLGLTAGAQIWNMDGTGSLGSVGLAQSDDLDFSSETQNVFYVSLEHMVPVLPNLKLRHTDLESEGAGNVNFVFEGTNFTGAVTSDVDLSHNDIILYYELLDNVVSLDLGLNVMQMDGHVAVTDGTNSERIDFKGYVPTLYIAAETSLPLNGLSLSGEISAVAIDDSKFYDYQVQLQYNVIESKAVDVGLQLGYRETRLELDDLDNLNTDLEFSGPYTGLQVHF